MQSDLGGEHRGFSNSKEHGINHRVSCSGAHRHNGTAERKHRHIIEIGLSLLANATMPLQFWNETRTSAYLINRLPTSI